MRDTCGEGTGVERGVEENKPVRKRSIRKVGIHAATGVKRERKIHRKGKNRCKRNRCMEMTRVEW